MRSGIELCAPSRSVGSRPAVLHMSVEVDVPYHMHPRQGRAQRRFLVASNMALAADDDEYEIPLRDQRFFGSGLKRKRIPFVPSTSNEASVKSLHTAPSTSAADAYLSIVLNKHAQDKRGSSPAPVDSTANAEDAEGVRGHNRPICDICQRPIIGEDSATRHESSIAHQICLVHSHPPSHIDRRRKGLAVLESQGWDPDSRKGLGAEGEGMLHPIRARENPRRAGLGVKAKDLVVAVVKPVKLDAGKVRKLESEGKKKAERLREAFYRNDDVERYLGVEGQTNASLDLGAFKRSRRI